MIQVLGNTILPIFSIIVLGTFLRLRGVIESDFAKPANHLVYYVAIPAMFLGSIPKARFTTDFNLMAALSLLGALAATAVVGWGAARFLRVRRGRRGTFVQSCFHGNIGYLSFAIAYYALGESKFAQTAILSSFLILGQNLLAVWALTAFGSPGPMDGSSSGRSSWEILRTVIQNPIIVAVCLSVSWAALELPMPRPIGQCLEILSGMAFPTALLLIGASLSFGAARGMMKEIAGIGIIKLMIMPALGYGLLRALDVPQAPVVSCLILLATPPATVTYVMAEELGGDPQLAAASVSTLTLVSAVTYSVLLWVVNR